MQSTSPSSSAHGHPFIFVDRVLEAEPGKRAVGIKNVTYGEAILQGHYPVRPLMPNTLVLEAMAQVAVVALQGASPTSESTTAPQVAAIRGLVFHRGASPGDQLRLVAEVVEIKGNRAELRVKATVGNDIVAEGEIVLG